MKFYSVLWPAPLKHTYEYRIKEVWRIETEIVINVSASLNGQSAIQMIISDETF